jgi:hypothetical protein
MLRWPRFPDQFAPLYTTAGRLVTHPNPGFADYLTLCRGVDFERGRLAWCDWVPSRLTTG